MSQQQKGIDINAAFAILADRAKAGGEKELHHHYDIVESSNTNGSLRGRSEEEKKNMGQTIQLFGSSSIGKGECGAGDIPTTSGGKDAAGHENEKKAKMNEKDGVDTDEKGKQKATEEERKARQTQIRSKMDNMSVKELLNAIFEVQRERVVTYREYDRGLETVLNTGNFTSYPIICANATASFAVLSDTINTIRAILSDRKNHKDVIKLLNDLQKYEKEKLNMTAALHLERIRENNEVLGRQQSPSENGIDTTENDERIAKLLRDGVVSLRGKIGEIIEQINDTLEELRYIAAEEEEDAAE